jgi:hypothetical protein
MALEHPPVAAHPSGRDREPRGGPNMLPTVRIEMREYAVDGVLSGRSSGARVRRAILAALAGADTGVALDFIGVRAVSVPFVGACLDGLLGEPAVKASGTIVATRADLDVRETIAAALRLKNLALVYRDGHDTQLLGGHPRLAQTVAFAARNPDFTANDLAAHLAVTATSANNWIAELIGFRAITRTAGRHERGRPPRTHRLAAAD